ncbi:MAG: prolyl oligopeptidase family serine peptidase [Saccharofermentanales bacterium]
MEQNVNTTEEFLSTAKKCIYKNVGYDLVVYVHLPEKITGKIPVAVDIHGGGWISPEYMAEGEYAAWGGLIKELNRKGIAFVNVQYRLGSEKDRHPNLVYDCMDALAWVSSDPEGLGFDPDRIAVMGASAGGHLSLLSALGTSGYPDAKRPAYKISAIVDICGPTDLCNYDYEKYTAVRDVIDVVFGGAYERFPDEYKRFSPIYYIDNVINPPALQIIHGDSDSIVPFQQSYDLFEKTRKLGWDVQMHVLKNADHGGNSANGQEVVPDASSIMTVTQDFLIKHLSGKSKKNQ